MVLKKTDQVLEAWLICYFQQRENPINPAQN